MSWCPDFEFRGTQVKAGLAPVIDAAVAVEAAAKAGLVAETEAAVAVGQSTDAAQRRKQAQAELTKAAKARKTHELRSASCDDLQLLTLATLGSYTEPAEEATALLDASTRLAAALLEVWHHISPPPQRLPSGCPTEASAQALSHDVTECSSRVLKLLVATCSAGRSLFGLAVEP